ncbi:hypothetical protein JZ751_013863, partial [Albula glossodonta]
YIPSACLSVFCSQCCDSIAETHMLKAIQGNGSYHCPEARGESATFKHQEERAVLFLRSGGNTEMVQKHETSAHLGHLQLLLQATSTLQACLQTSKTHSPDAQLRQALAALHLQGGVEVDGGDIEAGGQKSVGEPGESAVAHSLQDDQMAMLLGQRLEELQQRVNVYENIVTVLNREMEKTQLTISEQQQKLVIKDSIISSLSQRITAQEDVSYNGTFLWKVTFFLLDQNQKEHVIDAFRPDLASSSFQRPVSDMNVASGCPLFFPLAKLRSPRHAYVKDDTLFIKCIVDTTV